MFNFNDRKIWCLVLAAFFIACGFTDSLAQSKKLEAAVISKAKKTLVSQIEAGLPRQPFAVWFQELVGRKTPVTWEVNDCGEQTGDPSVDRGRDFPMCVDAIAKMSADFFVSVNIQYGTFKRGITRNRPAVRYISVGEEELDDYVENLSNLPQKLNQNTVKVTGKLYKTKILNAQCGCSMNRQKFNRSS